MWGVLLQEMSLMQHEFQEIFCKILRINFIRLFSFESLWPHHLKTVSCNTAVIFCHFEKVKEEHPNLPEATNIGTRFHTADFCYNIFLNSKVETQNVIILLLQLPNIFYRTTCLYPR